MKCLDRGLDSAIRNMVDIKEMQFGLVPGKCTTDGVWFEWLEKSESVKIDQCCFTVTEDTCLRWLELSPSEYIIARRQAEHAP